MRKWNDTKVVESESPSFKRPSPSRPSQLFAFFGLQLSDVKLQLFAFEDISIGAADLSRARGDGGQNPTRLKLLFEKRVNLKDSKI